MTPLPPLDFERWVVIVKPPVGVSTAGAYAALDAVPDRVPGNATDAWDADYPAVRLRAGQRFQHVILAAYPEIAAAFDAMMVGETGIPPSLCGSGAAIFRLSPIEATPLHALAEHVRKQLRSAKSG